jgi:hypothetical protein
MPDSSEKKKLSVLHDLIIQYSYPDKKNVDTLREVDELLYWAVGKFIQIGLDIKEIEKIAGRPYATIGDESSDELEWLYPCLSPDGWPEGDWFLDLTFRKKMLSSIERKRWVFIQ